MLKSIFKKIKGNKGNSGNQKRRLFVKCDHDYIFWSNRILGMRTNKIVGVCRKCEANVNLTYREFLEYESKKKLDGNGN